MAKVEPHYPLGESLAARPSPPKIGGTSAEATLETIGKVKRARIADFVSYLAHGKIFRVQ